MKKYLVKISKNTSRSETFNELRRKQYIEKCCSLLKLTQTSSTMHGNLKRCTSVIGQNANLLFSLWNTLVNLYRKRKMVQFYLKTSNVSYQNTSWFFLDAQLNIQNNVYVSNMELFTKKFFLANKSVTIFENQSLLQKIKSLQTSLNYCQCSTNGVTRQFICSNKIYEIHPQKSAILSKIIDQLHAFFHMFFPQILLVQIMVS